MYVADYYSVPRIFPLVFVIEQLGEWPQMAVSDAFFFTRLLEYFLREQFGSQEVFYDRSR